MSSHLLPILHHLLARPPPSSVAMTNGDYESDLNEQDPRPPKRPRQLREGDDGHRPYNPMSGTSGLQSEGDGGGEGGPKKPRKRPLSCGECRRYVRILFAHHCILTTLRNAD